MLQEEFWYGLRRISKWSLASIQGIVLVHNGYNNFSLIRMKDGKLSQVLSRYSPISLYQAIASEKRPPENSPALQKLFNQGHETIWISDETIHIITDLIEGIESSSQLFNS